MKYNLFSNKEFYGTYEFPEAITEVEYIISNVIPWNNGITVTKLEDSEVRVVKPTFPTDIVSDMVLFMHPVADVDALLKRVDAIEEKIKAAFKLADFSEFVVYVTDQEGAIVYTGFPENDPLVYMDVLTLEEAGQGFGGFISPDGTPEKEVGFDSAEQLKWVLHATNLWENQYVPS